MPSDAPAESGGAPAASGLRVPAALALVPGDARADAEPEPRRVPQGRPAPGVRDQPGRVPRDQRRRVTCNLPQ